MQSLKFPAYILLSVALGVAGLAHADSGEQEDPHAADSSQWGLGLGVGTAQRPYTGVSRRTTFLPIVMYESKWLHFFGNSLDLKLPSIDNFEFSLRAKYALNDGYKSSDAPILNGMQERKGSFWIGGAASWDNPYAKLSLELLTDASGKSKGNTLKLGAEHTFSYQKFRFTPHAGATWMDSKYVDYYYGVQTAEATATRAAYAGKSTANLEAGIRTDYALTRNQLIMIDISDTRYGTGITDSPLVDKSSSVAAHVAYVYKF
ncbi:MAG: MipA/OmpV family protein [Collimonas sp.]|uniref:MipA/OmpV family protein n=1 Tax=Collimonas sp. TaxID=1963772 RepID=UPI003266E685